MAAPIGNQNGLRNASRTSRYDVALPYPGKRFAPEFNEARKQRAALFALVRSRKGTPSKQDEYAIDLAMRYELTSRMAVKSIRQDPSLPTAEVVTAMRTAVWAAQRRTDTLRLLGLDGHEAIADPWLALDAARVKGESEPAPAVDRAADAALRDVATDPEAPPC